MLKLTFSRFFVCYRDVACTIYPVVPDCASFGDNLNIFLANRATARMHGIQINVNRPYGMEISWLALLFAVLASGSQSSNRTAKERELTSQVYSKYVAPMSLVDADHRSLLRISSFTNGEFLNTPIT